MLLSQRIILPGSSEPIVGPSGIEQFENLGDVVTKLLPVLFAVAGLILLFMLISAGFQYLTSAGDAKAAESAQRKLTSAIIGFVLLFIAFWLTQLLISIFGFSMFGLP